MKDWQGVVIAEGLSDPTVVNKLRVYAAANRLYTKLGYIPDGRGITPHDNELHLIKDL